MPDHAYTAGDRAQKAVETTRGAARRLSDTAFRSVVGRLLAAVALLIASCLILEHPRHAAATVTNSWTHFPASTAELPPRAQYGMAADNSGNVYIYGGHDIHSQGLADFWLFRPGDGTWQQLKNSTVPPLIEPHLAVDASGNVFEFGGIGDPSGPHFTPDGHSFGLYEYVPSQGIWLDLTPADAQPDDNWPQGREDHGFTYDALTGRFYVFAGEGPYGQTLNDMWNYNEVNHIWSRVPQNYANPSGPTIYAREIYNISDDNHGGFYLFGGSYLAAPLDAPIPPLYVNDLWHFDIASHSWTLLEGKANDYDPRLLVPRHYYGQSCDLDGNFYVLGGYVSDTQSPPFFQNDRHSSYALRASLTAQGDGALITYGLSDFWQFSAASDNWTDLSNQLGDLTGAPFIPYVMVDDTKDSQFVTFGGYHQVSAGMLAASADAWTYGIPQEDGVMSAFPTPASTPTTLPQASGTAAQAISSPTTTPVADATPTAGTPVLQPAAVNVLDTDNLPVLQAGGDLFGATLVPADPGNPPQ